MSKFNEGVEAMRAKAQDLIKGWMTNSNATRSEDAMLVLGALAGDIMIATVQEKGKPQT
jgi:hypothetical protein